MLSLEARRPLSPIVSIMSRRLAQTVLGSKMSFPRVQYQCIALLQLYALGAKLLPLTLKFPRLQDLNGRPIV